MQKPSFSSREQLLMIPVGAQLIHDTTTLVVWSIPHKHRRRWRFLHPSQIVAGYPKAEKPVFSLIKKYSIRTETSAKVSDTVRSTTHVSLMASLYAGALLLTAPAAMLNA